MMGCCRTPLLATKQFPKNAIPPEAGADPVAISKAYTDNPISGIAPGQKNSLTFRTPASGGEYWLFCGVPGHGVQGMYVNLSVHPKAAKPVEAMLDPKVEGRP